MSRKSVLILAMGMALAAPALAQEAVAPDAVVPADSSADAAPADEAPPVRVELVGDESKTYRGVLAHAEYWVPLPEQWELTRDALLELHFAHSPVLIERLSTMTAFVNGNAVSSAHLGPDNAQDGRVTWNIPVAYLKTGESNYIELVAKMRSDLELCDDVHSPAVWFTIERASRLVLRYREKAVTPNLAKFPHSYLRPEIFYSDSERKTQVHTLIAIPKNASAEVLNAVGVVSGRIGADTLLRSGALEVVQIADLSGDIRERIARHNVIIVGPPEFVEIFRAAGLDVPTLSQEMGVGLGHLFESPNPLNPGRRALVATGADDAALAKVTAALSLPFLTKEWEVPKDAPPIRAVSFATKPEFPAVTQGEGSGTVTVSLADLGSSDFTQRGKFHHYLRVAFPNPYVGRIKSPAFIRLVMAHSELLVAATSSILVKIDNQPVRSIRLAPRTAKSLEADVIIPEALLNRRTLVVDLEFYLDIGDADCHYNFPEMAWITVFNSSFVAYPLSDDPTTSLRSYPWVVGKEASLNGLVLAVADDPSDQALSVVANVAAYLGKRAPRILTADGRSRVEWIHPWVRRIGTLTDAELAERDLVVVGDYATVKSNGQVLAAIPETMFAESVTTDNLRAYTGEAFRADAGWIHLGKSPWNARRNLLVVSGAKGEPAFTQAGEYLWVDRKVDQLAGSAVLVGANGAMEMVLSSAGEDRKPQMGPLEPQLPKFDPEPTSVVKAESSPGVTAPAVTAPAVASAAPAIASDGDTTVATIVFVTLGLLLVILVAVRVRDAMRPPPSA